MPNRNTEFHFHTADKDNFKFFQTVVVSGRLTQEMKNRLDETADNWASFDPNDIGIYAFQTAEEDGEDVCEVDGYGASAFSDTTELPTSNMTVGQLVAALTTQI